ncbi:hypothetical protein Sjap_002995 [Stephania japonica]|uniref:Uncharacterized protein n=1 Tax=Stephania japonica TaxID=461633 RepID=A0AAP0PUN0_9MAGN
MNSNSFPTNPHASVNQLHSLIEYRSGIHKIDRLTEEPFPCSTMDQHSVKHENDELVGFHVSRRLWNQKRVLNLLERGFGIFERGFKKRECTTTQTERLINENHTLGHTMFSFGPGDCSRSLVHDLRLRGHAQMQNPLRTHLREIVTIINEAFDRSIHEANKMSGEKYNRVSGNLVEKKSESDLRDGEMVVLLGMGGRGIEQVCRTVHKRQERDCVRECTRCKS